MIELIKISIDAMGGDLGPEVVISGANLVLHLYDDIHFIFHGIENKVLPILNDYPNLKKVSTFIPCETAIPMDAKPSNALRAGRGKSSMWKAIDDVKRGEADACVSAGNTGALMAMSYFILGMLAQVSRPAIAGIWPNLKGEGIVLDIGASMGADSEHLVNLAVMGACMYQTLYGVEKPTVGLLNIGSEEIKGLDQIKQAHAILKKLEINELTYSGFVEGNDIGKGVANVVVTEGFTGNIALKTAEGTSRQMAQVLKEAMQTNILTKLGYLLSRKAFSILRKRMDPAKVNGGVLLGINGIVVKSHGHTTPEGFASAIKVARKVVNNQLKTKIETGLNKFCGN